MLVIAQNCIVSNLNRLSNRTSFLDVALISHILMVLYIKRPKLDDEGISRGIPSASTTSPSEALHVFFF